MTVKLVLPLLLLLLSFIMPGGAVRLAGLGAGPPSRLCHKDSLFWPQPALDTEMTVSDEGWGSVSRSLGLNRRGALPLCYTTLYSTLCYYVTLPHLAHYVTMSHCHMHTCVMLQYTYCIVH